MLTYIIQIVLFQILFLAVYDFFLSKETFHKYNRWYLLATPILSFVLPLIKIPTFQKSMPQEIMVFLPEIMLSPQRVIEQTTFYADGSIDYLNLLFWIGVSIFSIVFLIKLFKIVGLILKNETIKKHFYKLILLPKQNNAFSFFNYIFLGEEIPTEKKDAIIEHELIHAKQKHSVDLLFFELLKIIMWFNPMIYFYQHRITLLHEYISDEAIIKSTNKQDYFNTLLNQTFQVENISFVNQFHKHSLIKKRIIMMTKNKSNQIRKAKYLLLLPLLASMLFYTSCSTDELESTENSEIERLKQTIKDFEKENKELYEKVTYLEKTNDYVKNKLYTEESTDVPFAVIENVPVFPGCTGTRKEKADCLNSSIRSVVAKIFNTDLAKIKGLSKGKKKIWVQFRIDEKGNIENVESFRSPHPKLGEEAERVVKLLPKMEPGKQRGKTVGMKYTLPISFMVE